MNNKNNNAACGSRSVRRLSTRSIVALASASLLVAGGCSWFGGGSDSKEKVATTHPIMAESTYESDNAAAAALQPMNRPVSEGPLPLAYLVESPCTIRVSNVSTGEEIARFAAKGGEIVRVETRGVLLANHPVMGAQLAAGTYSIEQLNADAGVVHVQQTHTTPMMPPSKPASQPAAAPHTPPTSTPPPQ